jgi:DNA-binding NtrC family response regulator
LSGKTMRQIEREAAVLALKAASGNQSKAAKILGISRPTLARLLRETETPAPAAEEASTA